MGFLFYQWVCFTAYELTLIAITALVSSHPPGGFSLLLFMLGFFGVLVLALILIWRSSLDWILRSFNCEGGFYFYCCSCFGYENSILAPQIPLTPILFFHLTMRTIAWNCRGVGRASTVRALKELIRESNPDIVFLSETKIKSMRLIRFVID